MSRFTTLASIASVLLLITSPAVAQEALSPMGVDVREPDLGPPSRVGITVTGGGGLEGFVDDNATSLTDIGGAWTVRVGFFSRFMITPELSYIGSAQRINAAGLDSDAVVLSNGGEANLRLNILPGMLQPYIFGGVGFRYYELVNTDVNNSPSVRNDDTLGVVPAGVGLTLRVDELILDARGTFRWAFEDEMLTVADEDLGMSTWAAELRAGVEF